MERIQGDECASKYSTQGTTGNCCQTGAAKQEQYATDSDPSPSVGLVSQHARAAQGAGWCCSIPEGATRYR